VKVHIIGIPSAGKTTLATRLSELLGIPFHSLDELAFIDDRWTPRPVAERDAMLTAILREPSFITEGGFLGWTEDLLDAADVILWLDPPLGELVWRHIRRFAHEPRRLPSLLRFQIQSYRRPPGSGPAKDAPDQTRSGIERALIPRRAKVVRARRAVTVDEIAAYLERGPFSR
jgi:hypothetical protein